MNFLKLLYPGMHVKRWILLLLLGITAISLGIAYVLVHLYREQPFPDAVWYVTLQFIDRPWRGAIFAIIGFGVTAGALLQLSRAVLAPFLPAGRDDNIVETIFQHRYLRRGPKVVAIGGGTGLSALLRGLKEYSKNITAIVTVADDGGSSGRLRRELGILPPGDFRQCIVALADVEPLMAKLFQYRFDEGSGLEGHSFGNLFIVAMTAITGNFERAIRESSRVLAVRGQIFPSTLADLTLCAESDDGVVRGESQIPKARQVIKRLFLQPQRPPAYPEAIRSILEADLIVVGPGSLYTSVLPNLLVEDITRAIRASDAVKVFVCNVATQEGETDDFSVGDHVEVITRHLGGNIFNYVLANSNLDIHVPARMRSAIVPLDGDVVTSEHYRVVIADVIDAGDPLRHEPKKLAQALMRIYYDRVVPSRESQRVAAARLEHIP